MGFLPWEIRVSVPGKTSCNRVALLCFRNPLNSDMDYMILNVHTDVSACDCTRGCTETVRESALKVDPGRKILFCTGESDLNRRRAGPMLHQLSYIPIPKQACEQITTTTTETRIDNKLRLNDHGHAMHLFILSDPLLRICSVHYNTTSTNASP